MNNSLSEEDEIRRGIAARQRSRYLRFARPPQEKQLIAARKRTMKEKKFLRLITEIAVLALLVFLLFCVILSKMRINFLYRYGLHRLIHIDM